MSTIQPRVKPQKLTQVPPGTQNIVIPFSGDGVFAIGYYQPFKVFFWYEGGGGNTTVNVSIDGAQPTPLQPGQYNWSASDVIIIDYSVDPNNGPKFVWIFQ